VCAKTLFSFSSKCCILCLHLVPFFSLGEYSPHSGQFSGENIRFGSRGDSYYEYLIKIWIQQKDRQDTDLKYLYELYTEAIPKGLVFVGELPYGSNGGFSPKMDHLVC
jgi:endoplasmic reticulum Man9GlcNAc2 1,2-alpha-mannosidase